MKTYMSLGIGDAICIDSLLTQEERNSITEIFWACRFGLQIAPLFEKNKFYPNLRKQHFIPDEVGMSEMCKFDRNAVPFWHFRCDFPENRDAGLRLFGLKFEDVQFIDAAGVFQSDRPFNNSSFVETVTLDCIDWNSLSIEPNNYILFHYPTSTRPRSDIASISSNDWSFIESLSKDKCMPVVVITDTDITPPLSNFSILKNYDIKGLICLAKYASYYAGCDSFLSITCCKTLSKDRLFIKSHKHNIQSDIKTNRWQQKYFLPYSGEETSHFYKNYIGW